MDAKPKHRSRRSFPNLQHLSLAPLSSRFPMDGDDDDAATADTEGTSTSRPRSARSLNHSYYQGKSAPATPSILSRSNSRHRKGRRRSGHADMLDLDTANINLTKAKSAVGLDSTAFPSSGGGKQHVRTSTGTTLPHHRHALPRRSQPDDEWLHRAGLVLAQESREYKGQSWLANRQSSTSLVNTMSGGRFSEDDNDDAAETPKSSRHHSRTHSRTISRVASARPSRRGSMAALGSAKFEKLSGMTPLDAPRGSGMEAGYFPHASEAEMMAEPDFLEPEDGVIFSGASEDEEVRSLSQQKGFGLGGLIDRLVGFSLFNVDEDAEETETDGEGGGEVSREESMRVRMEMLKKRREELARAARGSAENVQRAKVTTNSEDEGGWKDAAWLLGVASKVLY